MAICYVFLAICTEFRILEVGCLEKRVVLLQYYYEYTYIYAWIAL